MEEVTINKFNLDQYEFNMNEQNTFSMLIFSTEELFYCLNSECYIDSLPKLLQRFWGREMAR
jgi:hypothetical protein